VINQTYTNWELFIIDDGSTDDTQDKIQVFKNHPNIKIIHNAEKRGLIKCCNQAIDLANGEWIIRLDADDHLEHNVFEEFIADMKQVIEDYPECDVRAVYGSYYETYRDSFEKELIHQDLSNNDKYTLDHAPLGAGCFVQTYFLRLIGGYDEEFDCRDGYYLWLQLIAHVSYIRHLDIPFFTYYRHPTSLSNDLNKMKSTEEKIRRKYLKDEHSTDQLSP
jgi:glycosyltransferase involved in cell wall biosynthesis